MPAKREPEQAQATLDAAAPAEGAPACDDLTELALENARLRRDYQARDEALGRMAAELAEALRARQRFFANLNHELRTPLNVILCYAELLATGVLGELSERQQDGVERMRAASRRLADLVDDALELSEVESARWEPELALTDVGEVAGQVLETVRPEAERRNVELRLETPRRPVRISTDGAKLRRILLNLTTHAARMLERGRVRVHVRAVKGGIEVAVLPAGAGRTRTAPEPGSAGVPVDLAVAGRLTARLGGRLARRALAGHTGFMLYLPSGQVRKPSGG